MLITKRLDNPHAPTKGDIGLSESALNGGLLLTTGILLTICYALLLRNNTLNRLKNSNEPMSHPITSKKQPFLSAQLNSVLCVLIRKLPSFLVSFIAVALFLTYATFPWSATLHNFVHPVLNSSLPTGCYVVPFLGTLSALSPDLEYINALVEQDTVANLRYGILFLLALSSLGVYSIILAG